MHSINHQIQLPSCHGYTLVEVIVGMFLTSLLMLGMAAIWDVVNDQFFRLALRQKAVFVLHGEMERLAAAYRFDTGVARHEGSGSTAGGRNIYPPAPDPGDADSQVIDAIVVAPGQGETVASFDEQGEIFFPNGQNRNYVWIDTAQNIVAEMSWDLDSLDVDSTGKCYDTGTQCQELTLYLKYPYRFNNGSPAAITGVNPEELKLITIVGPRR